MMGAHYQQHAAVVEVRMPKQRAELYAAHLSQTRAISLAKKIEVGVRRGNEENKDN